MRASPLGTSSSSDATCGVVGMISASTMPKASSIWRSRLQRRLTACAYTVVK